MAPIAMALACFEPTRSARGSALVSAAPTSAQIVVVLIGGAATLTRGMLIVTSQLSEAVTGLKVEVSHT